MSALRRSRGQHESSRWKLRVGAVLAAVLFGCVPARGGWDAEERDRVMAEIDDAPGHRLPDLAPHFVPMRGALTLFLCRWEIEDRPLRIALPPDSEAPTRAAFRSALTAWADALAPLHFVETDQQPDIEVRVVGQQAGGYKPRGTADTVADCRISETPGSVTRPTRIVASLVRASIVVHRAHRDGFGRVVEPSEAERVGTALHELGHALGFAGHVALGRSVMVATRETVREIGARVVAGERLSAPTLRALYALPSGTVVGATPLALGESDRFEALRLRAARAGLDGPYTRVGDAMALVLWRGEGGRMGPSARIAPWPPTRFAEAEARFEILGPSLGGER